MFEKSYGFISDKYVTGSGPQVWIWRSHNQLSVASQERFGLPHLTNCDLLSLGHIKTNVQVDSPRTISTLKQQIINEISTILIKML